MNPTTEVVSAPVILPFMHAPTIHRYTDVDECREEYSEEYSEEFSETYVHPPLSLYPNLLDSTDLNSLYQTNRVEHVPLITKEDDTCFLCNLCQIIMNLLYLCTCCR